MVCDLSSVTSNLYFVVAMTIVARTADVTLSAGLEALKTPLCIKFKLKMNNDFKSSKNLETARRTFVSRRRRPVNVYFSLSAIVLSIIYCSLMICFFL